MSDKKLFGTLPNPLREELLSEYNKIAYAYAESKWGFSELSGGRFCEIVYSILSGYIDNGTYPDHASKPPDMITSCRNLEKQPKSIPRSIKILIPRVLISIYEIRNNRGVGHVGAEVNANSMDAVFTFSAARWVMGELVRIFHETDTEYAQQIVDKLTERVVPLVWDIGDVKRVLSLNFEKKEQALLILYNQTSAKGKELCSWVEYSNATLFKKNILKKGHMEKLWEYDEGKDLVTISPLGVNRAEELLKTEDLITIGDNS